VLFLLLLLRRRGRLLFFVVVIVVVVIIMAVIRLSCICGPSIAISLSLSISISSAGLTNAGVETSSTSHHMMEETETSGATRWKTNGMNGFQLNMCVSVVCISSLLRAY
jgi:hypothetical protein